MKYCIKCGAELNDDVKFCTKCGAKQPERKEKAETPRKASENIFQKVTAETPPDPSIEQKGKKHRIKPAVAVLILVCTVVAVAVPFLFKTFKNNSGEAVSAVSSSADGVLMPETLSNNDGVLTADSKLSSGSLPNGALSGHWIPEAEKEGGDIEAIYKIEQDLPVSVINADENYSSKNHISLFPSSLTLGYAEPQEDSDGQPLQMEADNIGIGSATYKCWDDNSGTITCEQPVVYNFTGDQLGIGIYPMDQSAENTITDIYSTAFDITCDGSRMTLTHDGQSVTYVSDNLNIDSIPDFYLAKGSKTSDNLYGVTQKSLMISTLGLADAYLPGQVNSRQAGYISSKNTFDTDNNTAEFEIFNNNEAQSSDLTGAATIEDGKLYVTDANGKRILLREDGSKLDYDHFFMSDDVLVLEKDDTVSFFYSESACDNGAVLEPVPDNEAELELPEIFQGENAILPSVVTRDDDNNWVSESPEGTGDHSLYNPEMLTGTWVLQNNGNDEIVRTSEETSKLGYTNTESYGTDYCVLPMKMTVKLLGDDVPDEINGMIRASFTYPTADGSSTSDFSTILDVSGDTLAVGFTDLTEEELGNDDTVQEFHIGEMDYSMKWNGTELELTYGDATAVYTPQDSIKLSWDNPFVLGVGQPAPKDKLYAFIGTDHVHLSSEGTSDESYAYACTTVFNEDNSVDVHLATGEQDGDAFGLFDWPTYDFKFPVELDNGKLYGTFTDKNDGQKKRILLCAEGDTIHFDRYCASGDTLTLWSGNSRWTYYDTHCDMTTTYGPDNDYTMEIVGNKYFDGTVFTLNGKQNTTNVDYALSSLTGDGFATSSKTGDNVESRTLSDDIALTKDGVTINVRTLNPYAKAAPLSDTVTGYLKITDTTGKITVGDGITCGKTTKDNVKSDYPDPVKETDTMLIYRTANKPVSFSSDYGSVVLDQDTGSCYIVLTFSQNGSLTSVEFYDNVIRFDGLRSNIGDKKLSDITPDVLLQLEKDKEDILSKIIASFKKAGLDITVDETTGTVSLDDGILFGYNQSSLSSDGKKYLDQFLAAYAEAIFGNNLEDKIDKVQFDGYTDTRGTYAYNQTLSEKRASTVLEYCVGSDNNAGLSAEDQNAFKEIAAAAGHSYEDPIYKEDGSVDMDASRRVEINLTLKLPE